MATYKIEATDDQQRGLAGATAAFNAEHENDDDFTPLDEGGYLAARVAGVLDSYAGQYPAPPPPVAEIKAAIDSASDEQKQRIAAILAESSSAEEKGSL